MNTKTKHVFSILILLSIISICLLSSNKNLEASNFVPNEATAIKIAEAIWLPIYGNGIYDKQPFKATLKNEVWEVRGTLPEGARGGVPYIKLRKTDCKVLKVTHGK